MKRALRALKTQNFFWRRGADHHQIERIRAADASKSPEKRNRSVAARFRYLSSFQKKVDVHVDPAVTDNETRLATPPLACAGLTAGPKIVCHLPQKSLLELVEALD